MYIFFLHIMLLRQKRDGEIFLQAPETVCEILAISADRSKPITSC